MPRKHPLLPTREETAENPDLAYSDHLPISANVPVRGNSVLNLISLNVLSSVQNNSEENGGVSQRYERIVKGLCIKNVNVDILLLQNAVQNLMQPVLVKHLADDWEINTNDPGIISCYRKTRLKLQATNKIGGFQGTTMTYQDVQNNCTINVHNIGESSSPFPSRMEKEYETLLADNYSEISIIIGTGPRIAPYDNEKKNITTSLLPPTASQSDLQVPDYLNGGFYRDAQGNILQLETKVINYATGCFVEDKRTQEIIDTQPDFRMIMCLDSRYRYFSAINNQTIFEYEIRLRETLREETLVRIASDFYNNRAIGIRFMPNSFAYTYIRGRLEQREGFQFRSVDEGSSSYPCVFAPLAKENLLHQAIESYRVVQMLDQQIERLKVHYWYFRDVPERSSQLEVLRERIRNLSVERTNAEILEVIETWENTYLQKPIKASDYFTFGKSSKFVFDTNKDLMGFHRNRLFDPRRPDVLTTIEVAMQDLKVSLGWRLPVDDFGFD